MPPPSQGDGAPVPPGNRAEQPTAAPFVPPGADLERLREAAAGCRGCHLHENATQTVFGEGATTARVVLVGEQPGDMEDRRGRPFVGPAGQLLDRALGDAGIDRGDAYVTNTVKHFKFTMASTGKRRIHAKPEALEINACRPWLDAELALLDPEVVVCLGATAAQALLGRSFRITKSRGALLPWPPERPGLAAEPDGEEAARQAAHVLATLHPSAVLRADDRDAAYAGLVADLRVVAQALG
jgi:uracil-DNA glycosylase family protein